MFRCYLALGSNMGDRVAYLKAAVAGLLSGSRGTYATEAVRHDEPLLKLLGPPPDLFAESLEFDLYH